MQAPRSFRKLFVAVAVIGLLADQGTKYGMFRWLYHGGEAAHDGAFAAYYYPDAESPGGRGFTGKYDLAPGWFEFTAEFDLGTPPGNALQTWSAPVMPRVNKGALFGMGGGYKEWANGAFAAISVLAAAGILVWALRKGTAPDRWLCLALGLILGGTVGNLYDRVVFGGVRDFLHFYRVRYPVFNVADCALVCGAALLLIQAILAPAKPAAAPAAEPAGAGAA